MSNDRIGNLKGLLADDKKRLIIGLTVAVIAVGVAVSIATTGSSSKRPADLKAAASIASTADVKPIPGTSQSAKHVELIQKKNQNEAKEAEGSGKSSLPTLTSNADPTQKDPFDLVQKRDREEEAKKQKEIPLPELQKPTTSQQQAQQAGSNPPPVQRTAATAEQEKNMQQAMIGLLGSWTPTGQRIEHDLTGKPPQQVAQAPAAQQAASGQQSGGQPPSSKVADIKAAQILHAVVLTAINSDEPGPVLAQVVSGPYSGTRLLGAFERPQNSEKIVLRFQTFTSPNAAQSQQINAVAVDPGSARTAMASDVDNHYLQRYGFLLAGSFLNGFSQAIKQSGAVQTTTTGTGGSSAQTAYPQLSTKDKMLEAFGEVGKEVSQLMRAEVGRPPTITLNAGTPIGLLFLSDVSFQ